MLLLSLLWRLLLWSAGPVAASAPVETFPATIGGATVMVDVHASDGPTLGAVVLVHGFLRARTTMSGHAAALAKVGATVFVPDLPSLTDSRENAAALVDLVAQIRSGGFGRKLPRVVLAGFSAGGLATLLAAKADGVVGYVGLDAFDRPSGIGLAAARSLHVPAILLRGPRTFCNAYGIAAPWAEALPSLLWEQTIEDASHCDFESPTDAWCTFFCGATDPARQRAVADGLLRAAERLLRSAP